MNKNKIGFLAVFLAAVASIAYAVGLSGLIVNQPGLTYSKRFVFNLQNAAVNTISATAVYSSATFTSGTFSTGQVSTGSFLVVSNTVLSSAAATNTITVASTSGAKGDSIVIPYLTKPGAYVLTAGRDWNYKATTALTGQSIRTALRAIPWLTVTGGSEVLTLTTPRGSLYNSVGVTTNNTDTLTIGAATFTGGRDAETLTVNGYAFRAGRDFTIGATGALTATAIANAINAKAGLSSFVTADTLTSSVTLQSKGAGTLYNFPLATSNASAVSVLHPFLVGGANAGYTLGGKNITIASNGFTVALPVLYSLGSGAAAIGGLTAETTYYAVPVDANTFKLSKYSTSAVAGVDLVTLTSSNTLTAAKSYTVAPLAWVAGTAGFDWEVSNDGTNWSRLAVSSVTYTDLNHSGTLSWSLTPAMLNNYPYLGFNVTKPTSGGLGVTVTAQGTYTY